MLQKNQINSILDRALFSYDYDKGLIELQALPANGAKSASLLYAFGLLHDHLALFGKNKKHNKSLARGYYNEMRELFSKDLRALYGLGRMSLHEKRFIEGITYFKKALDLAPTRRFNRLAYATAFI